MGGINVGNLKLNSTLYTIGDETGYYFNTYQNFDTKFVFSRGKYDGNPENIPNLEDVQYLTLDEVLNKVSESKESIEKYGKNK